MYSYLLAQLNFSLWYPMASVKASLFKDRGHLFYFLLLLSLPLPTQDFAKQGSLPTGTRRIKLNSTCLTARPTNNLLFASCKFAPE